MRRTTWFPLLSALTAIALGTGSAFGQSWNVDASGNWSTGSNWSGGTAPNAAGVTATFAAATITGPRTITLDTNVTVGTLSLSPNYLLTSGGGTLTLNNNASTSTLSGAGLISANINIAGTNNVQILANSLTSPIVLTGSISASGGEVIIGSNANAVVLGGTNTYTSTTTLSAGGILRANQGGGLSANSNLNLLQGVLESLGTTAYNFTLGTAGGQLRWSSGGGFSAYNGTATVRLNGGAALTWGSTANFVGSGSLQFGSTQSNGLTDFQNAIDLNGSTRTVSLNYGNANSYNASGYTRMSGALTGTGGLNVSGRGALELTGTNTYSGQTTVTGGSSGTAILRAVNGAGLSSNSNLLLNGGILEGLGATTFTRTIGTGAGQVQWGTAQFSYGGFSAYNGTMAVQLGGNTNPVAWSFGSIGLTLGSASSNALTDFQNGINLGGVSRTIMVYNNSYSGTDGTRISGVISNGSLLIGEIGVGNAESRGTLELTGANTYSGMTTIGGSGVALRATPGVGLPTSSNLRFLGGVLELPGNTTFNRTLGTGAGQVQWDFASGGFSANGGPVNIQLNNGTGTLTFGGTDFANRNTATDALLFGSGTATGLVNFQNGIDMGTNSTVTVNVQKNPFSNADYARISGQMTNTNGNLTFFQINSGGLRHSGTLELTGTNVMGGSISNAAFVVVGGALRATDGVGLPSTIGLNLNGGVLEGIGTTTFNRLVGLNLFNRVSISGSGGFSAYNGVMTVRLNNGNAPVAFGTGDLNGVLLFGSQTANNLTDFQNGINSAVRVSVTDNPFEAGDIARISGQITGTTLTVNDTAAFGSGSQHYYTNRGTLELTANNTYTGTTTVGGGALRANNGTGLPANSLLAFSGGVLESQGASPVTFSRVVGTGTGNVVWAGDGGFSAGQANMTVQLNGGTGTVTWGQGGFVPAGSTLKFGSGTAAALTDFQNGINLAGGTRFLAVTDNIYSTGDRARISGVISNGGLEIIAPPSTAFNPLPAGTIELTAANTYALGTGVRAGTLLVNNTSGSGTGSGGVFVDSIATLGGTGRIDGATTIAGTLKPGSPDAPTGTLTINNNLTLLDGARLLVTVSGAAASKVVVVGDLNLNSALDGVLLSGTLNGTSTYVVMTYTGTRTGTFNDISVLTAQGYTVDYGTAGQISFVPVPEPASVLGIAAVGVAVVGGVRRWRRK